MQKLINVLALASFGVSVAVVAGGSWVYVNRYKLVNDVKIIAEKEIMELVPGLLSNAMGTPSLPTNPSGTNSLPGSLPSLPFGG